MNSPEFDAARHAELEAAHLAKQDALVASIPPDMIGHYVPKIKILERQTGAFNQILFETRLPGQDIFEEESNSFMQANPQPSGTAPMEERRAWIAKHVKMIDDFWIKHPEFKATRDKHVEELGELYKPTSNAYKELKESFFAEGGTDEQFEALRQAVLARKYSSPRPQQPASGFAPG